MQKPNFKFFKNNKKFVIIFGLILLVGIYLRLYRHDDFLHFELDQARDSIVISQAIEEGPGELPLLGPRAAGTMLRLGPVFYYFQYLSALIFGNTPPAMNSINMFFSILAIPLLYIFLSFYFSKKISLLTSAVFSVSLFAVTYSKFAWNPNSLPFFILSIFIILNLLFHKPKKKKNKVILIYLLTICASIAMQLHFLAFLAVPVFLLVYLIFNKIFLKPILEFKIFYKKPKDKKIKRKSYSLFYLIIKQTKKAFKELSKNFKNNKKHYIGVFLLFIFFFSPVFINEYLTGADNTREFFKAISEKSERGDRHNLVENLARNYQEYSRGYFLIISGIEKTDNVGMDFFNDGHKLNFSCDKKCRERLPFSVLAFVFFTTGLIFLLLEIIKNFKISNRIVLKNRQKDFSKLSFGKNKTIAKLNFLLIILIFLSVVFFGFVSAAYKFPPRFLLTTLPIAFVFLALWLDKIDSLSQWKLKIFKNPLLKKNWPHLLIYLIVGLVIILNLYFNFERFSQQATAHTKNPIEFERDTVLKEDIRFTLLQQRIITDWIVKNSTYERIYVWAPPKYYRPFLYHLIYQRHKDGQRLRYSVECLEADFFAIVKKHSDNDFFPKGGKYFESKYSKNFGTLTVHKLKVIDKKMAESKKCKPDEENKPQSYARRYNWNEVIPKLLEKD
ncbi:MAG: phospholipid carrier-dependent glycosyltransferase [Candidatus Moranbacteria bacterium]|nr:phospholipid carrier-dependent glycosyltransferase [Candidatus Moranbacteria bacterium]